MRRRDFIKAIAGSAAAWPLAVLAQQKTMPVIGFLSGWSSGVSVEYLDYFRRGLSESGYSEGRNVAIEFPSA